MLSWQWGAALAVGGSAVLLNILLARLLGPAEFGAYTIVTTIAMIMLVLQNGGYRQILFRDVIAPTEAFPEPSRLNAMAQGHVILITSIGVVLASVVATIWDADLTVAIAVAIAGNAPRAIAGFVSASLLADGALAAEARWQLISRLLPVAAVVAAGLAGMGLVALFVILAVAQGLVLLHKPARRLITRPLFTAPRAIVRASLAIVVLDVVTQLYFRQNILLLQEQGIGLSDIGHFGLMQRLVDGYVLLLTPPAILYFRRVRSRDGTQGDAPAFALAILAGSAAAVALAALVAVIGGGDVIAWVFGEPYRGAMRLVPYFLAAALLMAPNFLLGQTLLAWNKERLFAIAATLVAIANLGLNLVLIPRLGVTGTAIAMVATEFLLTLLLLGAVAMRSQRA